MSNQRGRGGYHNRGGRGSQQNLAYRPGNAQDGRQQGTGNYNNAGNYGRGNFRGGPSHGGRGGGAGNRGGSGHVPMYRQTGPSAGIYLANESVPRPPQDVTMAEDRLVAQTKGKQFALPKTVPDTVPMMVPGRHSYGTAGRAMVLRTNYLTLTPCGDQKLYRHTITITGSTSPSKAFRRQAVQFILSQPELRNVINATDYASNLVTASKLSCLDADGKWSKTRQLLRQPPPGQQARPSDYFGFTVAFDRELSLQATIQQLGADVSNGQPVHAEDIIQALNIVIARTPNIDPNVAVGTMNKFFPYAGNLCDLHTMPGGLAAIRGYFSSARPAVGRMLLNVNTTSGAFFIAQALTALLTDPSVNTLSQAQKQGLIKGLRIEVRYKGGKNANNPVRTITGFSNGSAAQLTFDRNGTSTTVARYYQQQHSITLVSPNLTCINVGSANHPQHIPQELCWIVPGQQFRRFLNPDQIQHMLRFAARAPNVNAHSIAGSNANAGGEGLQMLGLKDLQGTADPQNTTVRPFGLQVGTQLLTVPGRLLQTPIVTYDKSAPNIKNGSWNYANQAFFQPGAFAKTGSVLLRPHSAPGPDQQLATAISGLFAQVTAAKTKLGAMMPTLDTPMAPWTLASRPDNRTALDQMFRSAKRHGIRVLLVVLDKADRWIYSQIKLLGDTKYGIHTVCSVRQKLQDAKGQPQYFGNLGLKFNVKGGGTNHSVRDLFSKPLTPERTMLVGIDVTHPSPGSAEGAPSIACVVANKDPRLSQWPGSIRKRAPTEEIVTPGKPETKKYTREIKEDGNIKAMMEERLALWKKTNKQMPDRIVVYRDGVSEGQYDLVLRYEWPEIQAAFSKFYGKGQEPKVAIIVVGKRHHTRFYPTTTNDAADRCFNPLAGTVVDRGIANKIMSEFWLQAHHGLQGTARPAHYVVIKDDIGFSADELQKFTHNLCYMFSRATKAISICPPAYYADLLADRARMYEYESLNENNSGNAYTAQNAAWNGQIHDDVKDVCWYI